MITFVIDVVYGCNRMKISEAESIILEFLWQSGPAAADEIVAGAGLDKDWKPATVKTLLNRLLTKGAITANREGRRYIYGAAISRGDFVFERGKGLIDRFFGGRIAPFISHFSEQEKLTREDIDELKKLIERLDDDK